MEITSQLPDGTSPLATVEQIRDRLIRPPSLLHSQSSSTSSTRPREEDATRNYSSRFDANSTELRRKREDRGIRNKRLEDYLDPTLLAAVRAEIGGKYRERGGERKAKEEVLEFEWPVDELKAWTTSKERRVLAKRDGGEAVDLGDDDVDVIRGGGGVWCSPFRRFEKTALKRFKG